MDKVKVIAKLERCNGTLRPILFFPETPANFGRIECWTMQEGHSEADMGYYRSLRNPEPDDVLDKLLRFYERRYRMVGEFTLVQVRRDTDKMRKARWKR